MNQGYTGCYKKVNGIVVDPTVGNSVNLFVNLGPLWLPKKNQRTSKLKAELDSSRKSRKKTAIQQHSKETHHSRLHHDHATDDEQLGFLTSQVTIGRRRGGIADKELSMNGVAWRGIFELLRVLDPQS